MSGTRGGLLALALVAACPSRAEPGAPASPAPPASSTSPVTPPSPTPPSSAAAAARASLIEAVRELSRFFASGRLTVDDVVRQVGPVAVDHGSHGPLELRSSDSRLARVALFRDDAGAPMLLQLDVAAAARPTLGDLQAAFGAGRAVFVPLEAAPEYVFPPTDGRGQFSVTLVARLLEGSDRSDASPVSTLTLRRDHRVE